MSYFNVNTVLIGRLLNIFQILTVKTVQTYTCFGLKYKLKYIYRPQRSWDKVIFPQASVILSGAGVCVVAGVCTWLPEGGMRGCRRACVVAGVCVVAQGGMHGCGGACVVAWVACMVAQGVHLCGGCMAAGDMCGCREGICGCLGGCAWLPGSMSGCRGACIGHDEIRSMSGR